MNKISIASLFIFIQIFNACYASESFPFQGRVNANNINIRSDSRASSDVICNLNKDTYVEVVLELYDWYKIRLPKSAPVFIKKDFVMPLNDKTIAKASKDRVNIRLRPDESSPIIGKALEGEIVIILKDEGQWYKIEPVNNSFGWIHKKFISKATPAIKTEETKEQMASSNAPSDGDITVEGVLRPKTITSVATHKLITPGKKIFLLKGNPASLGALDYHKVKVNGKLINPAQQKNPIIDVIKIERLD